MISGGINSWIYYNTYFVNYIQSNETSTISKSTTARFQPMQANSIVNLTSPNHEIFATSWQIVLTAMSYSMWVGTASCFIAAASILWHPPYQQMNRDAENRINRNKMHLPFRPCFPKPYEIDIASKLGSLDRASHHITSHQASKQEASS